MKAPIDGTTKIHNVKFYNLEPRSIQCFSYSNHHGKLALSRKDASIEIWDMQNAPVMEKSIPGNPNISIEDIAWADKRLFTVGLSGELCEWDLSQYTKKKTQFVTGSAIWCLDIDKTEKYIAVGTEEGYINIFDISDDDLLYKTLFDKQEGRILCCKYNHDGKFIVTGSIDSIRIWNTENGHAIKKITVGRTEKNRETIVWSLQVLRDFTIISGDSRGQITVWDGNLGIQIENYQVLQADVLALTLNEDENILICSGIEPILKMFILTEIKKDDNVTTKKWVKFLHKSVHDHDVKALVCAGHKVFSGGFDGYLGVSSYSREKIYKEISKYGPFLKAPCAYVAQNARLILLRYPNYLEIWKLGIAEDKVQLSDNENNSSGKILTLENGPEKLLQFRSKNIEGIISAAISPDGSILIYSTLSEIRVFNFYQDSDSSKYLLTRIKDVPAQFGPSNKILFSSDSKKLFLIKINNLIEVFKVLSPTVIDFSETIDASKAIKDVINLAKISKCGRYFIAASTCRQIAVWKKTEKQWKHFLNLPKYMYATTAIAIHDNIPRVVATFADGKIFEYDLEEMCFTCSTNEQFVKNLHSHCVNNIVLDPRNENVFILQNDSNLFTLKKNVESQIGIENEFSSKTRKIDENVENLRDEQDLASLSLAFCKTYEHLVHLEWLSETELIVVVVNPVSLIEQLPGALRQKKFGGS